MPRMCLSVIAAIVSLASSAQVASASPDSATVRLAADIKTVAALPGERRIVSAAGVSRDETAILTIENASAFDPAVTRRRLVLVGRVDEDGRGDAATGSRRWGSSTR